jgi:hypothetical protein
LVVKAKKIILEQIVGSSWENSRGSGGSSGAKTLVFIWKIFQKIITISY